MKHAPSSWRTALRVSVGFLGRPISVIRNIDRDTVRPDLIAGITVGVILLPQAIAYALLADLPPQMGIYTAIVSGIIGALWGSSDHIQTGPTNTASLLLLAALAPLAAADSSEYLVYASLMAVLVGVIKLSLGLLRVGFLVAFVSDAVVIGFTTGAAVLIAANQMPHLLRLQIESSPSLIATVVRTGRAVGDTHWPTLLLGVLTLAIIALLRRFRPFWPGPLIGMVVAGLLTFALGLQSAGILTLDALPQRPPMVRLPPIFDFQLLGRMWSGALAVAAIGLIEAASIGRSLATRSGQFINSSQEFVGQGLANIAAGVFGGFPGSGSFTRSVVNYDAGARTALAAIVSSLFLVVALLVLAPTAVFLPRVALAAVLMVTAYTMVDRASIRRILASAPGDAAILIATFIATLFLPLQFAVLAGVTVSFVRYIAQTSTPSVLEVIPDEAFAHFVHEETPTVCPQLGVITVSGSLYFGSAQHVEARIRAHKEAHPEQQYLLLRMHHVNHADITGIRMLESIVRLYRSDGGDVYMMRVYSGVYRTMEETGFDAVLGHDHFLPTETAIAYLFYRVLHPGICIHHCQVQVWRECQQLPKQYDPDYRPLTYVRPDEQVPSITASALRDALAGDEPPLVVDVRERAEYETGHIPGSQLLPLGRLITTHLRLPTTREIVLVARTGRRSRQAVSLLAHQGWTQTVHLEGGIVAWQAAGLPLASPESVTEAGNPSYAT